MSFLEIVLVIVAIFVGFKLLKYIWALVVGIFKLIAWIIAGIFKLIGYIFRKFGKVLLYAVIIYFIFSYVSACRSGNFRTPTARITDLSFGYLTESDYNSGNFSDAR